MRFVKLLVPVMSALLLFTHPAGVRAEEVITVNYNGKVLEFETAPYIKDDRVLVPLRKIMETMGVTINWDSENQIIGARRSSKDVYMKIGVKSAYINNEQVPLDIAPEITNGSTFVPLRFIGESMCAEVGWDGQARSVTIKFNDTFYKVNEKISFGSKELILQKTYVDDNTFKFTAEGTLNSGINGLTVEVADDTGYVIAMQTTVTQKDGKQYFKAEADLPGCHAFVGKYVSISAETEEQKLVRIGEYILE